MNDWKHAARETLLTAVTLLTVGVLLFAAIGVARGGVIRTPEVWIGGEVGQGWDGQCFVYREIGHGVNCRMYMLEFVEPDASNAMKFRRGLFRGLLVRQNKIMVLESAGVE